MADDEQQYEGDLQADLEVEGGGAVDMDGDAAAVRVVAPEAAGRGGEGRWTSPQSSLRGQWLQGAPQSHLARGR